MKNELKQKVSQFAAQIARQQGVDIFDVELLGKGKLLLRIIIDKSGGTSIDDCERFSKSFSSLLDVEDPLPGSYTLEVSSPGIDRPLRNVNEFEKNRGNLVRIITSEKIENQNFFVGHIADIDNETVKLSLKNREIEIPFHKISKARLEFETKCQKNSHMS
jgi:ribosome maturation factor RimP